MDNFLSAIKMLYPEIFAIMAENLLLPTENMGLDIVNENNCFTIMKEISDEIQNIADKN